MVVKKSGSVVYDVSLTPKIPYTQQIPYKIFVKITIIIRPITMTIIRISSIRASLKPSC